MALIWRKALRYCALPGLYLPVRMFVYEDKHGETQVSSDNIPPLWRRYQDAKPDTMAQAIDAVPDCHAR